VLRAGCFRPSGGPQGASTRLRSLCRYQLQQEVQQQLPPPQVVLAPGATWMKAPPVAVLPI
jgi:hypothetical protein